MMNTKHYDTRQYVNGMELTVRQSLEKMYCDAGVSDGQAAQITERLIAKICENSEKFEIGHKVHWDGINFYPKMMLNFWFNINRKVAYDWAEENLPLAWWKLVFTTKEQQLAEGLDIDKTKT